MKKTLVNDYRNLIKKIAACLLLLVMALPAVSQVAHLLEGHEHEVCSISSDHLHESKEDCSDLHFTPQNILYNFTLYPEFTQVAFAFNQQETRSALVLDSYIPNNTQLRAPPVIA